MSFTKLQALMRELTDSLNCCFRHTLKPAWHQSLTELQWFLKTFLTYKIYGLEKRLFLMFHCPSISNEISSRLERNPKNNYRFYKISRLQWCSKEINPVHKFYNLFLYDTHYYRRTGHNFLAIPPQTPSRKVFYKTVGQHTDCPE
jgi:hypothetical protein